MQNVVILGGRAFGIEICNLAKHCVGYNTEWQIKGFLDDNSPIADRLPFPVLASADDYQIQENDIFICALGSVAHKKKYINIIKEKGGRFLNLISSNSIIDSDLSGSEGLIIASFCTVSNNVTIGNHVTLHGFTTIGHDCSIGDFSHLGTYSFMGGGAIVEDSVQMNTRATVLPKVKVRSNVVIGAGSVVVRNVPPDVTVVGNPATIFKF